MRRSPYRIGFDHGLKGLPQYAHHVNGRRYDSANANASYVRGYGEGQRQRRADNRELPLFRHVLQHGRS